MKKVMFRGEVFYRTDTQWVDESYLAVAEILGRELEARYSEWELDRILESGIPNLIMDEARRLKKIGSLVRAEKAIRKLLEIQPANDAAQAMLCSVLRALKRPKAALRDTEGYVDRGGAPLLTSRAAAHCDLEQWERAKRTLARALARSQGSSEAFSVVKRIKRARPELYR